MGLAIWGSKFHWQSRTGAFIATLIIGQAVFGIFTWTRPIGYFSMNTEDWLHFGDIMKNYDGLLPKGFDSNKNLRLDDQVVIRTEGKQTYPEPSQAEPSTYGKAQVSFWSGTRMIYTTIADQPGYAVQRTVYFPGWHALVNDSEVKILSTDSEFPGRVLVPIPQGQNEVKVYFDGHTPARDLGKVLSVLGLIGAVGYLFFLF